MKKYISILLVITIIAGVFAFAIPTSAKAPKNCFNLKFTGYQRNDVIDDTLAEINKQRQKYGYAELKLDSSLQKIAERRAADIVIANAFDYETLPTGKNVKTILPNSGTNTAVGGGSTTRPLTAGNLASSFGDLKYYSYQDFKSVGLAVFEFKTTKTYYWVASTENVKTSFTGPFAQKKYSTNIDISYNNVNLIRLNKKQINKYGAYSLSVSVMTNGFYNEYFGISNSWLKYTSSKSNVYKIKGYKGFAKYNGDAIVTVKDLNGVKLDSFKISVIDGSYSCMLDKYKTKSVKKNCLHTFWYRESGITGYQIQYTKDKKFKKGVKVTTVKGAGKNATVLKGLTSSKYYYVRVRSYIYQGDKEYRYSPWGSAKAYKIK